MKEGGGDHGDVMEAWGWNNNDNNDRPGNGKSAVGNFCMSCRTVLDVRTSYVVRHENSPGAFLIRTTNRNAAFAIVTWHFFCTSTLASESSLQQHSIYSPSDFNGWMESMCDHVNGGDDGLFVEIFSQQPQMLPDRIEAYVSRVEPRQCSPLLKEIAAAAASRTKTANNGSRPLSHLKRVRRITIAHADTKKHDQSETEKELDPSESEDAAVGNKRKRQKTSKSDVQLQVLLGAVQDLELFSDLIKKNGLQVEKRWLPGRPAESKQELEEFNEIWPTVYFHKQTQEFLLQECKLTQDEIGAMMDGMQKAIQDAKTARQHWSEFTNKNGRSDANKYPAAAVDTTWQGAVILCPRTRAVVARASEERLAQQQHSKGIPDLLNPLCTPILLAIQGVSRIERKAAMGHGMDSASFQNGQVSKPHSLFLVSFFLSFSDATQSLTYPCWHGCFIPVFMHRVRFVCLHFIVMVVGVAHNEKLKIIHVLFIHFICSYDMYTTKEPSVFEAMALVHSRIRRVVFGIPDKQEGGLGGCLEVHALPGTNHKYRVFTCAPGSVLSTQCNELQSAVARV